MDRFYREQFKKDGLHSFQVMMGESDLFFVCDQDIRDSATLCLKDVRRTIEQYCADHRDFKESLSPVEAGPGADPVIHRMAQAGRAYDVGPMASVAGAVASYVGEILSPRCSHLIIENGGDIFIKSSRPVTLEIFTGLDSPFAGKIRFVVESRGEPLGVCTSSGRIGHSLSFGNADAVVAIADDPVLADAGATSIANKVKSTMDIDVVLEQELERGLLKALIIVIDDRIGAWGDIKFI